MNQRASSDQAQSLGEYLASLRKDRGLSLRRVEELTNKQISNAYLNQIETGKIQQPSPNILYVLAETYQTSYQTLMSLAGFATEMRETRHVGSRLFRLSQLNPSQGEERELVRYLNVLRSKSKRREP